MNKYELVVVVDGMASQEEKEPVLRDATEAVSKNEGKVINSQMWLDKHKLSFNMKKCTHGTYYLVNFESKPSAIEKIKQTLNLNEKILRFLVINLEK